LFSIISQEDAQEYGLGFIEKNFFNGPGGAFVRTVFTPFQRAKFIVENVTPNQLRVGATLCLPVLHQITPAGTEYMVDPFDFYYG